MISIACIVAGAALAAALAPATTPTRAAAQEWDPKYYMKTAGFVPELGRPVMDALPPPPARVLDVGCGEGTMAFALMAQGYDLKGVDLDGSMVARARERGVDAFAGDAQAGFPGGELFDAVISNAALHWMPDQEAVVRNVAAVLTPGGVFTGECGGVANCAAVRDAIADVIGTDAERALCPWTFPSPGDFRSILRDNGFRDGVVSHFKRPVKCDPVDWLKTFGKVYLDGVEDQEKFLQAYRASCARHLPDGEIDYVRLRWRAVRQ